MLDTIYNERHSTSTPARHRISSSLPTMRRPRGYVYALRRNPSCAHTYIYNTTAAAAAADEEPRSYFQTKGLVWRVRPMCVCVRAASEGELRAKSVAASIAALQEREIRPPRALTRAARSLLLQQPVLRTRKNTEEKSHGQAAGDRCGVGLHDHPPHALQLRLLREYDASRSIDTTQLVVVTRVRARLL